MTQTYATFPNGGIRMKPIWVTKVVNQYGAVVYQDIPQGTPEFSPQVSYIMTKMMEWVLDPKEIPGIGPSAYATGYQLGIGRPAAGKTGTNNGEEDAWFMGYEPQLVVGVWVGNKNGEVPQYTTQGPAYGATAAGPIWQQIMQNTNRALNIPVTHFSRPTGVTFVRHISTTSGELASPYTPAVDVQGAWFINGTQPTTVGDTHYLARVSALHPNQLWQPGCGPYISSVFLRQESDWHAGVPYIWDSRYWAPTQFCHPSASGLPLTGAKSSTTPPSQALGSTQANPAIGRGRAAKASGLHSR
jgi:penicillin-binding protein 1A